MNNSSNYPVGAEYDSNAPWNKESNKPQEVEVTVSITLSRTVKIKVDDYTAEEEIGEDGEHFINYDFSKCDLEEAVREQITLPNEETMEDWDEDDFEVVLE